MRAHCIFWIGSNKLYLTAQQNTLPELHRILKLTPADSFPDLGFTSHALFPSP